MKKRMDKRRQALEEKQAELHMELLMDDYAAAMGTQIEAEAKDACAKGEISLPPELDASIREMIDAAPEPGKTRKPGALRYLLVAVLTAVVLLGAMIAVQAAGIDIFGKFGTWTDSVFRFETNPDHSAAVPSEFEIQTKSALGKLDLPLELAPTWLPEGYEITSIELADDEVRKTVNVNAANADGKVIVIFLSGNNMQNLDDNFEKTATEPVVYVSNRRRFYLFENTLGWTGAWSTERYIVQIGNVETVEDLQRMIDSMGECNEFS